jgi:O-antigen ligase
MSYYAGLLFQLAVFDSLFTLNGNKADDGGLSRQLFWGFLGAMSIACVAISATAQRERRFSFGGWPMALLLTYVFVSATWSVTPESTLKRAIIFSFVVISSGIGVGACNKLWRTDEFSKMLATPLIWLVGLSLLLTLLDPGRTITEIGWRGVSGQKNEAGQMMAVVILLLLYGVRYTTLRNSLRLVLLAFASLLLMFAQSTTSLVGLLLSVAIAEVLTLRSTLNRSGSWKVAILGALLGTSVLVFIAYQIDLLPTGGELYSRLLASLGKSETLTGRTAIWDLVLGESRFHNPLVGAGYGGFWVGPESISGYVRVGDGLYPWQAHNGYIDIYNELGILGLFLLLTVVFVALFRVARLHALNHVEAKLHLAIVLVCLVLNLGESTFFRNSQFMNIVFFASFIRTAAILRCARLDSEGCQ